MQGCDGREFIERAARILEDTRELMRGPSKKDPYAGVLRIVVCPASLEWLLVNPQAELIRCHPSIRLEVTGGKFETMVQLVRTGAVDVAVGFAVAFQEWPGLTICPISDFDPALFVRVDHPLLGMKDVSAADLARFAFISPSDSRRYGSAIRDMYEAQGWTGVVISMSSTSFPRCGGWWVAPTPLA